jgi:hypothetical protein
MTLNKLEKATRFGVCALLCLCFLLGDLHPDVSADPMTPEQIQDTTQNTNWVASSGNGASSCGTLLNGTGNGVIAFNYFVSKGLSNAAAAGIVGNLSEESTGVDPERLQSNFTSEEPAEGSLVQSDLNASGVGWGIAQWTPPSSIITSAQNGGTSLQTVDTLNYQLAFLWQELTSSYQSTLAQLKSAATPEDAATIFLSGFERGDPSPTRQGYARAYYELAVNNTPLPPNVPVSNNSGGSSATTDSNGTVSCGSAGGTNNTVGSTSGYTNPLRSVSGLTPNRIDEGVDYDGTGPVYAIGAGTVVNIDGSGWPGNVFIVYKLSNGSAAGKYVYFAEDCTPSVSVGQSVTSSTQICTMYNGGSGIETGWAQDPSNGDVAMAADVYKGHDGLSTAFGQNFSQLLQSLGAPPGNANLSTPYPGVDEGTLPAGWPTW